jgi:hypothetical protein
MKYLAILLIALLLPAPALRAQDFSKPTGYLLAQSEERQVWVNTATGILSLPRNTLVRKHETGEVHERERRDCSRVQGCEEWTVKLVQLLDCPISVNQ